MIFLALVLAASIESTPPKVVFKFDKEDQCLLAAMKLNAKPEMNTEEAKTSGANYICLSVVNDAV